MQKKQELSTRERKQIEKRLNRLFTQFLILLSIGICISFLLLAIVQLPEDRPLLSTLLVVSMFVDSPVAVRLFLCGLRDQEEDADERTTGGARPNSKDGPV